MRRCTERRFTLWSQSSAAGAAGPSRPLGAGFGDASPGLCIAWDEQRNVFQVEAEIELTHGDKECVLLVCINPCLHIPKKCRAASAKHGKYVEGPQVALCSALSPVRVLIFKI